MPWREVAPVDLRLQFVSEHMSGLFSVVELTAQYGISRKTAYKWIDRYERGGPAALEDQSRRPHGHPDTTAPDVVAAVVALRRRHPHWGAKKLLATLHHRQPTRPWPARSTVCDVLRRHALIASRPRRPRVAHGRHVVAPVTHPNATWTTDFKGEFRTRDRQYCYPLTLRDGFSRYVLRCDALLSPNYALTRRRFERAFAEYGLPTRIRSDNGGPFAGQGVARLSRLNVWWMRLGIIPERIMPGRPEQNGSHEQFHAVLKAATTRPPAANARAQQARFQRFCREYNDERPHESLGDRPPATVYEPSWRSLPTHLPPLEYPGHMEVRRVWNGYIKWKAAAVFLSDVLSGEDVAFEEVDDGLWTIYFATVALARFNERTRTFIELPRAQQQ